MEWTVVCSFWSELYLVAPFSCPVFCHFFLCLHLPCLGELQVGSERDDDNGTERELSLKCHLKAVCCPSKGLSVYFPSPVIVLWSRENALRTSDIEPYSKMEFTPRQKLGNLDWCDKRTKSSSKKWGMQYRPRGDAENGRKGCMVSRMWLTQFLCKKIWFQAHSIPWTTKYWCQKRDQRKQRSIIIIV